MLALHSGTVKHPCVPRASITAVFLRVARLLRILKQAKHCRRLHVYAIVCGMTVGTDSGPVYPDWSFGDRIRKARTTTGKTQEEFATAIGVKEGTLAAWETDRAQPRSRDIIDVVKRIEALTNIPVAWLLGIMDGPPPLPPAQRPSRSPNAPVRHLRSVAGETADLTDDALAYLRLADPLPRLESNQQPFGYWYDAA